MSKELPVVKTEATIQDVIRAFAYAWLQLFNEIPKKESICILLAQSALETGRWKSMHCWNFGNIKSVANDGRDYCYFACNEELDPNYAKKVVANSNGLAKITGYTVKGKAIVWLYRPHPGCKFRAFDTIEEGAIDHLSFIRYRYGKKAGVWDAVLKGDVVSYCQALSKNGYFTADVGGYTKSVSSIFREYMKNDLDLSSMPPASDAQMKRISDLVQISMQDDMAEEVTTFKTIDPDENT